MNRPCPVHLDARLSDEEFEAEMSNAQDRECWAEKAARVLYAPSDALTAAQNATKAEYARRLEAENELERFSSAVSSALGSHRFMDPPDGGGVMLEEQVARMRAELEEAETRAEKAERERDELRAAIFGSADYDEILAHGNFLEMARATESGRQGAIARAVKAETDAKVNHEFMEEATRQRDEALARVERLERALTAMLPENNQTDPHCRPSFETCERARAVLCRQALEGARHA